MQLLWHKHFLHINSQAEFLSYLSSKEIMNLRTCSPTAIRDREIHTWFKQIERKELALEQLQDLGKSRLRSDILSECIEIFCYRFSYSLTYDDKCHLILIAHESEQVRLFEKLAEHELDKQELINFLASHLGKSQTRQLSAYLCSHYPSLIHEHFLDIILNSCQDDIPELVSCISSQITNKSLIHLCILEAAKNNATHSLSVLMRKPRDQETVCKAMSIATGKGYIEIVRLILKIDKHIVHHKSFIALYIAALDMRQDIFHLILSYGAPVDCDTKRVCKMNGIKL